MNTRGRDKLRAVSAANRGPAGVWRALAGLLIGCVVAFHSTSLDAQSEHETGASEKSWIFAENSSSAAPDQECATRFPAFIRELDTLLASDPPTIYPVHDLLNKYFPVVGCDIREAIEAARKSQFFLHAAEETIYYVVVFDSRGFAGRSDPGFHVQIAFLKASGNSWLPSANINLRYR